MGQIYAVCDLCRQRMKWEHFYARLQEDGRHAAAQVLHNVSVPSFAQWRRSTLLDVIKSLSSFVDVLALYVDAEHFAMTPAW